MEIASGEIPRDVLNACRWIWISFIVALLKQGARIVSELRHAPVIGIVVAQIVACALTFLVYRWITKKLKIGRNWMRLLVTIFNVAGFLFVANGSHIRALFADDPFEIITTLAEFAICFWYVRLLNTSRSRDWFNGHNRSRYSHP